MMKDWGFKFGLFVTQLLSACGSSQVHSSFNLSSLQDSDGSQGFVIQGVSANDNSGWSVSGAGDINDDGYDDVIIGAPEGAPGNVVNAGTTYVVYGSSNGTSNGVFELSSLNGANGFFIDGNQYMEYSGRAVSDIDDINGDGIKDLIIGNPLADVESCIVIFGSSNISKFINSNGLFEISELNGENGFIINNIDSTYEACSSMSSAGDVNGDGYNDIIIGAPIADPGHISAAGETYIVFGGPNVGNGGTFDLRGLNGFNGFMFNGTIQSDYSGNYVSSAGDFNQDGYDDLLISSPGENIGKTYLIYGFETIGTGGVVVLRDALFDGENGFIIEGYGNDHSSGGSVSGIGDFNGDGFPDIIIGDPNGSPSIDTYQAGVSYILYGGEDVDLKTGKFKLEDLNGQNGITLNGVTSSDNSGYSVSRAGDVNGDGYNDVIIGAPFADVSFSDTRAGVSYIVYGNSTSFTTNSGVVELSDLNGFNGYKINGIWSSDFSGWSVSNAGDVNGDGYDDVIIGAENASPWPFSKYAGQSYIVYGKQT